MITEKQYNEIKNLQAPELKKWLSNNNLSFNDVFEYKRMLSSKEDVKKAGGPFCACCGLSQKDGEEHDEECMWYEGER